MDERQIDDLFARYVEHFVVNGSHLDLEELAAGDPLAASALRARVEAFQRIDEALGREHQSLSGRTLGRYEVRERLGAGGMGEVYRALDRDLGREVALKVLPPLLAWDPQRRARFEREARILATLDHRNIGAIYGLERTDGLVFLALELVPGETLGERIGRGPLPLEEALALSHQIVLALEAAHAKGVVHRDLKPANVKVTPEGTLKLLDFGLGKSFGARGPLGGDGDGDGILAAAEAPGRSLEATATGLVLGTAAYMSPEQAKGEPVDHRADIFSFGIVFQEMLTAKNPFTRGTWPETRAMLLGGVAPPVSASRSDIDAKTLTGLQRLLDQCLAKDPAQRHATATALRADLERIRSGAEPRTLGSKRGLLLALGGGLLLAVAAVVWWLSPSGPSEAGPPMQVVPFTSDGGAKNAPNLSPDGERVAYQWTGTADDNWDIYVKGMDAGAIPLRLTTDPANDTVPAWSPDGREIAFIREIGSEAALFTVPANGGPERRLTDIPYPEIANATGAFFYHGSLSWSPDGRWLVFSEKSEAGGPSHVVRFSPATGQREVLSAPRDGTPGDLCPALSPDGTRIAFVRSVSSAWGLKDVWVQPVSGGEARQLTHGRHDWCCSLAWTPDGRDLLFTYPHTVGAAGSVFRVSLSGGAPRPVLGAGLDADGARVRGTEVVYVQYKPISFGIWRAPGRTVRAPALPPRS